MRLAMVDGLRSALSRSSRARPGGRSARVVSDVLSAATREFARHGYEAMRVEDVATIAGVNKTTVYRRWPSKADLVAAALRHSSFNVSFSPDTGSVRGDLLALLDAYVTQTRDPIWRGVVRAMMVDIPSPELARLLSMFRAEYRERWMRVVQRGIERHELPKGTSAALVSELVLAVMTMRRLRDDEPLTPRTRRAIVDIVLAGSRSGAAILDPPAHAGPAASNGARPSNVRWLETKKRGHAQTATAATAASAAKGSSKANPMGAKSKKATTDKVGKPSGPSRSSGTTKRNSRLRK